MVRKVRGVLRVQNLVNLVNLENLVNPENSENPFVQRGRPTRDALGSQLPEL